MIGATGVSLRYPDGTVGLKEADWSFQRGELVILTGQSGSGKTSLLHLLMGLHLPTTGVLEVLGHDMTALRPGQLRNLRQQMGPVFQDFRLTSGRHALENIMAGICFLKGRPMFTKDDAFQALERVGLRHKAYVPVENLSWGERQRVAIARAVARRPALILADEPTGNLDRENATHILDLLASLRNQETLVVITTHATHLIENMDADQIVHLEQGGMTIRKKGGPL